MSSLVFPAILSLATSSLSTKREGLKAHGEETLKQTISESRKIAYFHTCGSKKNRVTQRWEDLLRRLLLLKLSFGLGTLAP